MHSHPIFFCVSAKRASGAFQTPYGCFAVGLQWKCTVATGTRVCSNQGRHLVSVVILNVSDAGNVKRNTMDSSTPTEPLSIKHRGIFVSRRLGHTEHIFMITITSM